MANEIKSLMEARAKIEANLKDPIIREKLNQPIPQTIKTITQRVQDALAKEDNLSEDGMQLLSDTFRLLFVYSKTIGEKEGHVASLDKLVAFKKEAEESLEREIEARKLRNRIKRLLSFKKKSKEK